MLRPTDDLIQLYHTVYHHLLNPDQHHFGSKEIHLGKLSPFNASLHVHHLIFDPFSTFFLLFSAVTYILYYDLSSFDIKYSIGCIQNEYIGFPTPILLSFLQPLSYRNHYYHFAPPPKKPTKMALNSFLSTPKTHQNLSPFLSLPFPKIPHALIPSSHGVRLLLSSTAPVICRTYRTLYNHKHKTLNLHAKYLSNPFPCIIQPLEFTSTLSLH